MTNPEARRFNLWHRVILNENRLVGAYSLADGGTSGNVKLVGEATDASEILGVPYLVDGRMQVIDTESDGENDDLWDCTGLDDTSSGEHCKVLLTLQSDGTANVYQGNIADEEPNARLPFPEEVRNGDEAVAGWIEIDSDSNSAHDWDSNDISSNGSYYEGYDLEGK